MKHDPVPLALALSVTRDLTAPATWKSTLKDRWHGNLVGIQERLSQAVEAADASATQRWSIAAGIATEKTLLLDGQPTVLVAHLHEHRHDMGALLERLGSVARRVGAGTIDAIAQSMPGVHWQPPDVGHGHGGGPPAGRRPKVAKEAPSLPQETPNGRQ